MAAILTRMMDSSKRIRFTMGEETAKPEEKPETEEKEPLKIIGQPDSATASAGAVAEFFIEVEGGTNPYSFEWMAIDGQGGHATVEGQYGVQTMDDTGYGWSVMQMIVGNGNDWTTNEDFYCVVTDANGSNQRVEFSFDVATY